MRVYWNLDKHIVWSGFYTLISFIDINMKQSFFIFMVITLMLPQFVSAKGGKIVHNLLLFLIICGMVRQRTVLMHGNSESQLL